MEEDSKKMKMKPNQVGTVFLYGVRIVSLAMDSKERLCLAQISNTLLKEYSYNEIHNRRVALGITCVQCTPVQLEILRRAGAMPISSRRCGMITKREAERLCKSFLGDNSPPKLPENFAFEVYHECAWGSRGQFVPSRYNSSRAKCIKCHFCGVFFSPNKFVFHSHRLGEADKYVQPDAANFNSWRRHTKLLGDPPEEIVFAWEDIKAMFNGGTRKRMLSCSTPTQPPQHGSHQHNLQQQIHQFTSSSPSSAPPMMMEQMMSSSASTSRKQLKLDGDNKLHQRSNNDVISAPNSFLTPSNFSRFQSIESLIASNKSSRDEVISEPCKPHLLPFSLSDYVWGAQQQHSSSGQQQQRASQPSPWAAFPYSFLWPKAPFIEMPDVTDQNCNIKRSLFPIKPEDHLTPMNFAHWFDRRRTEESIFGGARVAAAAAAAAAALAACSSSTVNSNGPIAIGQTFSRADPDFHHLSAFSPVSTKPILADFFDQRASMAAQETSCSEVSTTVEVNEKETDGKLNHRTREDAVIDVEAIVKRETMTTHEEPQDFSIVKIVARDKS